MTFALLDTVVLTRDLPQDGLRPGDLGAVVELYGDDGVEVEFVQPSGDTKALVTLKTTDLRSVSEGDILAVRPLLLHMSRKSARPSHRRVIQIEYAASPLPLPLAWYEQPDG